MQRTGDPLAEAFAQPDKPQIQSPPQKVDP